MCYVLLKGLQPLPPRLVNPSAPKQIGLRVIISFSGKEHKQNATIRPSPLGKIKYARRCMRKFFSTCAKGVWVHALHATREHTVQTHAYRR